MSGHLQLETGPRVRVPNHAAQQVRLGRVGGVEQPDPHQPEDRPAAVLRTASSAAQGFTELERHLRLRGLFVFAFTFVRRSIVPSMILFSFQDFCGVIDKIDPSIIENIKSLFVVGLSFLY